MQLLELHASLLSDEQGQQAYRKAIFETIRAGDRVMDLGTGTGIHAVLACQAGAAVVYAVERHDFIEAARETARHNGFAERVHFLNGEASEINLPEKVDVIIAHLGLSQLVDLLPRARDRFLKPGGAIIPTAIVFRVVPLESERLYEDSVRFWEWPRFGVSFEPIRLLAVNSPHELPISPDEFLAEPVQLARLNFQEVRSGSFSATSRWIAARDGTLHGMGLWMEQWLTSRISINTEPPSPLPPALWRNTFLPIDKPAEIEKHDAVTLTFNTGPGEWGKLWTWEVVVASPCGKERSRFRQSAFQGQPPSKERLRKLAPEHRTRLTARGTAVQFVLQSCQEQQPVRWIEGEVARRFPGLCQTPQEAAALVAGVITRYSE